MIKRVLASLGVIALILSIFTITTHADEQPYKIEPVLPNNQDQGITSYISVSSNEDSFSQDLDFMITNNTSKTLKFKIKPLNALTSPNGVIQYRPYKEEENSNLVEDNYGLKDYIDVQDSLEVKGGETKIVTAKVSINGVDGTILGAIGFQTDDSSSSGALEGSQFTVKNETNRVIGLQVNFNTDNQEEFIIDEPFVDAMPAYYAIRLPITLKAPLLRNDVEIDYVVSDKEKELFESVGVYKFNFAPETKANFALPWEHESIEDNGTYTIKGELRYQDASGQDNKVPFDEEFTYEVDNHIFGSDVIKPPSVEKASWWYLLLLLIPLFLFILWKTRKEFVLLSNNEDEDKIIDKKNNLYELVQPAKEAGNKEKLPYIHYYKRKKKDKDNIYYEYKKTKEYIFKDKGED